VEKKRQDLRPISCASATVSKAYGRIDLGEGNSTIFRKGVITESFGNGHWLLLEDVDKAPPDIIQRLLSAIDLQQMLIEDDCNTIVPMHESFRVFTTMVSGEDDQTKQVENLAALMGRCHIIDLLPFSAEQQASYAENTLQCNVNFCGRRRLAPAVAEVGAGSLIDIEERLVALVSDIAKRITHLHQEALKSTAALSRTVSFAELVRFVDGVVRAMKDSQSIDDPITNLDGLLAFKATIVYVSPHANAEYRKVLRKLIKQHFKQGAILVKGNICRHEQSQSMVEFSQGSSTFFKYPTSADPTFLSFHPSPIVWDVWCNILHAVKMGLPIILVGPDGCGKSAALQKLAEMVGKVPIRWNCAAGTDTAVLFGTMQPNTGDSDDASKELLRWIDGPITKGVKQQKWVTIENLSLAEDEVFDDLSLLFDHSNSATKPIDLMSLISTSIVCSEQVLKGIGNSLDDRQGFQFLATASLEDTTDSRFLAAISSTDVAVVYMHTPHFAAEEQLNNASLWEEFDGTFEKVQGIAADDELDLCVEQVCADHVHAISNILLPMATALTAREKSVNEKAIFGLCLAIVSLPHRHLNLHRFAMVLRATQNLLRLHREWSFKDSLWTSFDKCIVSQIILPTEHTHSTIHDFEGALTPLLPPIFWQIYGGGTVVFRGV
jgi:MoxR-like ATPase